jgi:hypothetical protein
VGVSCNTICVAGFTFRHERDGLGHDFMLAAFLVIVRFPPALLETAIDDDALAFQEVLGAVFGLLAEYDDIHEGHFFFQLIPLPELS